MVEIHEPPRVLELVVFKLKPGVSGEQFLGTVDAVSQWAQAQPGCISRELLAAEGDDRWIDIIWWESLSDAKKAASLAQTADECAPMFTLIDKETMTFLHGLPAITPVTASARGRAD